MEFEGTVVKILPQVSGESTRGKWVKQEVIFEQKGEFGRKICVSFWGDKAEEAAALKEGEVAKVALNVESREYNGRWYTEARAWKLERQAGVAPTGAPKHDMPVFDEESPSAADKEYDDLPF